eukprot:CAMPEP_0118891492 /NCGR_PEP_ID=MMETSP1166-20130328/1488_1 /TAXON_ID=1104430 /ORGANISM="Chrysoreinhardia sp, Strain CCMP3193" /LENGTH=249 /DNA_ID=CAMNT_0006830157 /DNA_START=21 /DNA_END=770 /DNA_ORIENTATION=-
MAPSSRAFFGPFGRDAVCPYGLEVYSGTAVASDWSREIEELRVSRFRAGSYRIRGVELRYRGEAAFATVFGVAADDVSLASSLTLDRGEAFVDVSLGFYVGHLCSFAATTNLGRCVVVSCDHLEHFGVIESYHVHNRGARLRGLKGRCCHAFICSLTLCFDNSWNARGPILLLRELQAKGRAFHRDDDNNNGDIQQQPANDDDDDDDDDKEKNRTQVLNNNNNNKGKTQLLPRLFALPEVVQRLVLLFL